MNRKISKEEWCKKRRFKRNIFILSTAMLSAIVVIMSVYVMIQMIINWLGANAPEEDSISEQLSNGKVIEKQYLTPNPYSRPQTRLKKVNAIVIHYTANPGTSATNNRSYFEGLKTKQTTYASSHYIIGLEGEVLQSIPLTEQAYASNERNDDTISIECCHPDETGEFKEETYESLVSLTATLCIQFDLEKEDVIRHYDVTGKLCPLYYVEHEDAWDTFLSDVAEEIVAIKNIKELEKKTSTQQNVD